MRSATTKILDMYLEVPLSKSVRDTGYPAC